MPQFKHFNGNNASIEKARAKMHVHASKKTPTSEYWYNHWKDVLEDLLNIEQKKLNRWYVNSGIDNEVIRIK